MLSVTVLIGSVRTTRRFLGLGWVGLRLKQPFVVSLCLCGLFFGTRAVLCASLHTFAFPPSSVKCHCNEVPSLTSVSRVVLVAIQLALRQNGAVFCAFLTQEKKFAHFYGVDRARS